MANGKTVLYALTSPDIPFRPYQNELALVFCFDAEGDKVEKIEEIFDGVFMKEFIPRLERHLAEHDAKAQNGLR